MNAHAISLFDPSAGKAAKAEGQDRVKKNRPEKTQALLDCLEAVARTHASFTSDHLHEEAVRRGIHAAHPNLYGAVFSAAVTEGWLTRGGRVQASNRPLAKGRNLLVWDSLIFSGRAG